MRKLIGLLALAAGVFAMSALPAGAITGGSVEDTEHPFVGLVAFYDDQGQYRTAARARCSRPPCSRPRATAPRIFSGRRRRPASTSSRTRGQLRPADRDRSLYGLPAGLRSGHAGCDVRDLGRAPRLRLRHFRAPWREFPDIRDVGLVVLDQPINLSEYGELAADQTLDDLDTRRGQKQTTFTLTAATG